MTGRNQQLRPRGEYLTPQEIERLLAAARGSSNPVRDQALILIAFRHGLRLREAVDESGLRWGQIDLPSAQLHCTNRLKHGKNSVHPLALDEMKLLKKLRRDRPCDLPWVFVSRNSLPLSGKQANRIVSGAGEAAGFDFPIHFHMLRHSCGYALANKGYDTRLIQDWLGHKNIKHTVIYTELSPERLAGVRF
ncbi:MAG: tyrosine-type recombinase/integrase [Microcoleaceae cyanobacterium]